MRPVIMRPRDAVDAHRVRKKLAFALGKIDDCKSKGHGPVRGASEFSFSNIVIAYW